MSYRIKAVGIDLASVRSAAACISLRDKTWEREVLDIESYNANDYSVISWHPFYKHLRVANLITDFVVKQRPDIVGLEDYTMQSNSHVAFSFGEQGGLVRLKLLEAGMRVLLIHPVRINTFIAAPKKSSKDRHLDYVQQFILKPGDDIETSDRKETEDVADALIYSMMAAIFFAGYWLKSLPLTLSSRQRALFVGQNSIRGFCTDVDHFLLRFPDREAEFYGREI